LPRPTSTPSRAATACCTNAASEVFGSGGGGLAGAGAAGGRVGGVAVGADAVALDAAGAGVEG